MISIKEVKTKRIKSYTQPGKPLSTEEFGIMVKEADESGYMTPDEFKKKCRELRNTK
jgi:hypothetical protein